MWNTSHTISIEAPASRVWEIWEDADNWATLDENIEASGLNGPLMKGTAGQVQLAGSGTSLAIEITECTTGKTFTYTAGASGVTISATHEVRPSGAGCEVTMTLSMEGMAVFLIAGSLGKKLEQQLPLSMAKLKLMAEAG